MDEAGLLVVAPAKVRRCISLRLGVDGVEVFCDGVAPVALPWDAYGHVRSTMDGPALDGWAITEFTVGRNGAFGVTVRVSGEFDVQCHELVHATTSAWRRLNQWWELGGLTGHSLPVLPTTSVFTARRRERDTLRALATVLARRRDLRSSLSNRDRVLRLANDLSTGLTTVPVTRTGARRDTVDIIVAMHRVGLVHPFVRPVGHEPLPSVGDAVAKTRARLDANPFRKGRSVDDATIEAVIRSTYLNVKPWPFDALLP